MRFLKKLLDFKKKEYDNLSDNEIQDIKDIFQDYIDEYDLEKIDSVFGFTDIPKNAYMFFKMYDEEYFSDNQAPLINNYVLISIFIDDKIKKNTISNHINNDFKKRLISMGYEIKINDYQTDRNPITLHTKIEVRKTKTN